MTNTSGVQSSSPKRRNRFIAYLLLSAAAISAMQDLGRVQELMSWIHAGLAPVYASSRPADRVCPRTLVHKVSSEPVYSARQQAPAQSWENNSMLNEPEIGGEIATAAFTNARRSAPIARHSRVTEQRTVILHIDKRSINRAVAGSLANSEWLRALEFKTLSRNFTVELPAPTIAKEDMDTANADAVPDPSLSLPARLSRRHTGNSDHELNLKP